MNRIDRRHDYATRTAVVLLLDDVRAALASGDHARTVQFTLRAAREQIQNAVINATEPRSDIG